jgi:uncharacterized protein
VYLACEAFLAQIDGATDAAAPKTIFAPSGTLRLLGQSLAVDMEDTLLSYRKGRCKPHRNGEMPSRRYDVYWPAKPYFDLVRGALGGLVEGEHFFDIVAEDIVYEVLYDIAGWPRIVRGRADLMALFSGYCDNIELQCADNLIVHEADDGRVVVIEYEVHGTILATAVKYDNRFCSIIRIENRKIAHWRDYMDSLAAWNALTVRPR